VVPNLKNVLATYAEWFPYLPLPKLPAIFGLDSAGVVTAVGDHVRGVRVGDRVYVNPGLSCGSCRACRRGEGQNCPDYTFMGYFAFGTGGQKLFDAYPYGGLAEYLTAPERNLVVLPDSVTFEQAARFGYLGTAFSALRKAGAGPGRTVLIDGISGTLGLGACLIALGLGVTRILGTGRNPDLLDDVKAMAPDRIDVLPAGAAVLPEWVRERTDGEGVDIVIDALGPGAPAEAMLEAIAALARGGVLVDIGGMMERPGLDLFSMMCSQRSVIGSLWFSTAEAQAMADMAGSGALDLSVLEHHTFPLAEVNEALDSIPERHGGFTNFLCQP
jgi:threonine dehydrogenase-like Zn-dependent dehydrogenase